MSEKKKNVPKLRFSGFADDWEQRKLSELINEYREIVDSDCTLPILTSSKTEGVVLQEEHFGRKQLHDIAGYNILPRGYCTYRNRSDGVDFTFNINNCCDKGIISKFYPVFYGNNSNITFISMVLNYSEEVVHEIGYTCVGTGQKVLSFTDLQKMTIRVPSLCEQDMISDFFSNLDNLITLHQRKLEAMKEYKKGMLQKMFPKEGEKVPEIRFPQYNGDWERCMLSDLCDFEKGRGLSREDLTDSGKHPCILYGQLFTDYGMFIDEIKSRTDVGYEDVKLSAEGDILIPRCSTAPEGIGRASVISLPNVILGFDINILKVREPYRYLPAYISLAINAHQKDLQSLVVGTMVRHLENKEVKNVIVEIPRDTEEQKQICNIFSKLDNIITLHQRKLDAMKEYKKGLLQQMFV